MTESEDSSDNAVKSTNEKRNTLESGIFVQKLVISAAVPVVRGAYNIFRAGQVAQYTS
jgi:hypothetical protein